MQRLLLILCLLLPPGLATAHEPPAADRPMLFRHLDTGNGLPQNTVMATLQDSQGFMWFATEDGLSRYDGYEVVRYGRDRDDPQSLPSSFVWAIQEDRDGDLWVATKDGGVARWSRRTDRFTSFRHDPADPETLSSDSTRELLIDRQGRIWIGTVGSGLNMLDPKTGKVRRFRKDPARADSLASDVVTALHEDPEGSLWVGTAEGLHRLLPVTNNFRRYVVRPGRQDAPGSDKISVITSDRNGVLWVGTFDGGLSRLDRGTDRFTVFRADPTQPGSLSSNEVRAILSDTTGRLWVGTADGLNLMGRAGRFVRFGRDPGDPASLADNYVMSLYEDSSGLLWVGTRAGGVSRWNPRNWLFGLQRPAWLDQAYAMSFAEDAAGRLWVGTLGEGLHRIDLESGVHATVGEVIGRPAALRDARVMSLLSDRSGNLWIGTMTRGLSRLGPDGSLTSYRAKPDDPQALAVDGIMALLEARDGRIWVGTFGGGVNVLDPASGNFRRISYDPRDPASISAPRATSLAQDADGFVWVGTEGGGLNVFHEDGSLLRTFRHDAADAGSLAVDTVYALHADGRGRIWVGTDGGGLNLVQGSARRPGEVRFGSVSKRDGLASDIVYGVTSDAAGMVWVSSNAGLTRYDPESGTATRFHREHGLQGEEFSFGAVFRSRSGRLCFGGSDGFNVFDPLRLAGAGRPPPVVLTSVEVMNRPAETTFPAAVLPSLTIGHEDDIVSFEFAALDFTAPDKNRYAYRLVGFDHDWVDLGTRRRVSYTNLEPGKYRLEVRAANTDGVWSDVALRLPVDVQPAPWQTVWAKLLGAGSVVIVVLIAWRSQRRKLELAGQAREKLEREVTERTVELRDRNDELARVSSAKSDFLSRMSHEIRTPMNGVIGMTDLLRRTELSRRQSELVAGIHGSARSLLQILNEILDLARVESGKLMLERVEFDLCGLLEEAAGTFAAQAEEKGLELIISPPVDLTCRLVGDPLRVRQVLQNLVGNAVKFTASGEVLVTAVMRPDGDGRALARIEVCDTGEGMSGETLARVFEPFSQADESTTRRFGGTGLGLAICRQLVELMGGRLEATSEPGLGSTFTVELPFSIAGAAAPAAVERSLAGVRARLACRRVGLETAVRRMAEAWGVEFDESGPVPEHGILLQEDRTAVRIVDADSQPALLDRLLLERGSGGAAGLVVLARTGTAVALRLEERFGADAVVVKPVRREPLQASIARAAGRTVAPPALQAQAARRGPLGHLAGHVLVVEDNPVNAAVAEGMLAEVGCSATLVDGGHRAVSRALAERYDLILMDLHMPDLDGLTATTLIRRAEKKRRVPIIALTADAAATHRERCLAAGMDDFIGKPFTLEELHATLSRWLPVAPAAARGHTAVDPTATMVGLDRAALAGIRALDRPDKPRLLPRLVALYTTSSTQLAEELRAAMGGGDLEAGRRIAHSLKSASANVGAGKLAQLSQALETACAEGDVEQARHVGEQILALHPSTLDALHNAALQDTA